MNSRVDTRLDELEKATGDLHRTSLSLDAAVKELNTQFRHTEEQIAAMLQEMRAGFAALQLKDPATPGDGSTSANHGPKPAAAGGVSASPMPTFDGSDALAWLARAEQYFLIAGTAPEDRVGLAMVALAGAALPWYQLLRHRVPDLTWARFAKELMKRFGGNGALNEYEAFAAVPSPLRPPTLAKVTAPMLSSSPPTTAKENTLHAIQQLLPIQQMCTPLTIQQPIPPPVLVPLPSPPNPLTPATPPTLAPVTAPLLSTSGPYILQFQSPFSSLLRHTVPAAAAKQATLMYLFLIVHKHIPWFSFAPPVQKQEWEPPPNKVIGFNFELNLEGKVVSRVRQLIRSATTEDGKYTHAAKRGRRLEAARKKGKLIRSGGSTREEVGRLFGLRIRKNSKEDLEVVIGANISAARQRKYLGSSAADISAARQQLGRSAADISAARQQISRQLS